MHFLVSSSTCDLDNHLISCLTPDLALGFDKARVNEGP